MRPLADASATSQQQFVTDFVEPGAKVITDGWQGYCGLDKLGYMALNQRLCHQVQLQPVTSSMPRRARMSKGKMPYGLMCA